MDTYWPITHMVKSGLVWQWLVVKQGGLLMGDRGGLGLLGADLYNSNRSAPIVNQPRRGDGPGRAGGSSGAGLGPLADLNEVYIYQVLHEIELITSYEVENQYYIMDSRGKVMFLCQESSSFLDRHLCPQCRSFRMEIYDINTRAEVFHLQRLSGCPSGIASCCWCCCLNEMEAFESSGACLGTIKQQCGCTPKFAVKDMRNRTLFKINGPFLTSQCIGGSVPFQITTPDNVPVGAIVKVWSGIFRELFSDADAYRVEFPRDLDVKLKATLIAAGVLIDYAYYEKNTES